MLVVLWRIKPKKAGTRRPVLVEADGTLSEAVFVGSFGHCTYQIRGSAKPLSSSSSLNRYRPLPALILFFFSQHPPPRP